MTATRATSIGCRRGPQALRPPPQSELEIVPVQPFREKKRPARRTNRLARRLASGPRLRQHVRSDARKTADDRVDRLSRRRPGHDMQLSIPQEPTICRSSDSRAGTRRTSKAGRSIRSGSAKRSATTRIRTGLRPAKDEMCARSVSVDTGIHEEVDARPGGLVFPRSTAIDEADIQFRDRSLHRVARPGTRVQVEQLTILTARGRAARSPARSSTSAASMTCLVAGALPLQTLEERIDAWDRAEEDVMGLQGRAAAQFRTMPALLKLMKINARLREARAASAPEERARAG